ncbi:hypothetical protein M434DRAFT_38202 [Hypoxylon sp. CO27-5]|nr:hypothetical protein M434DRAFT_38202 [Hypoxylon sp. CO27-5]
MRSHGAAFAPLPSWHDDDEDTRPLTQFANSNPQQPPQPYYPPSSSSAWQTAPVAAPARTSTSNRGFSQPLRYHGSTIRAVPPLGVGTGLAPVAEEEQPHHEEPSHSHPHSHSHSHDNDYSGYGYGYGYGYDNGYNRGATSSEIDDFSRAYSSAGIGTQDVDEDRQPLTVVNPDEHAPSSGATSPGGSRSPTRGGAGAGVGTGNRPLWQQNRQQGRNLMWL